MLPRRLTRPQRLHRAWRVYAWLEPLLYMATFHSVVWLVAPVTRHLNIIAVTAVLAAWPFVSVLWRRESAADIGWRLDNLGASMRQVGWFTAAAALSIMLFGLRNGWELEINSRTLASLGWYLPWALGQQFVLQAFVYRRLRQACYPGLAAVLAALLFGSAHCPNPVLMVGTTVIGFCWCRLFQRTPNLFTLALSQAILAVLLASHTPFSMRIGPRYFQ